MCRQKQLEKQLWPKEQRILFLSEETSSFVCSERWEQLSLDRLASWFIVHWWYWLQIDWWLMVKVWWYLSCCTLMWTSYTFIDLGEDHTDSYLKTVHILHLLCGFQRVRAYLFVRRGQRHRWKISFSSSFQLQIESLILRTDCNTIALVSLFDAHIPLAMQWQCDLHNKQFSTQLTWRWKPCYS